MAYPGLRNTALAVLNRHGTIPFDERADLADIVMLRLWVSWSRLYAATAGERAAWVIRVTSNASIDYHRRKRPIVVEDVFLDQLTSPAIDDDPLGMVALREDLEPFLRKLPSYQRIAVERRLAGEVFGRRTKSVSHSAWLGVRRLREMMMQLAEGGRS